MHKRANVYFWIAFILFCAYSVPMLYFFGLDNPEKLETGHAVILTTSLLACGAVLRHWFRKNQDKFRR